MKFTHSLSRSDSDFNVIHLNIQYVNEHLYELLIYVSKNKSAYSAAVLTVSRLKTSDALVEVPGYRAVHSLRDKRESGVVIILFKDDLYAEELPNLKLLCQLNLLVVPMYWF